MDSHGHTYQKGKCSFCGRVDWAIDGYPQCDCEGRRDEEEAIIQEIIEEEMEEKYEKD